MKYDMTHLHFVCWSSSPATCVQTDTLATPLQVVHWHVTSDFRLEPEPRVQILILGAPEDCLLVVGWLVGFPFSIKTMRMFKQKIVQHDA